MSAAKGFFNGNDIVGRASVQHVRALCRHYALHKATFGLGGFFGLFDSTGEYLKKYGFLFSKNEAEYEPTKPPEGQEGKVLYYIEDAWIRSRLYAEEQGTILEAKEKNKQAVQADVAAKMAESTPCRPPSISSSDTNVNLGAQSLKRQYALDRTYFADTQYKQPFTKSPKSQTSLSKTGLKSKSNDNHFPAKNANVRPSPTLPADHLRRRVVRAPTAGF